MQDGANAGCDMTYPSPTTGNPVGLSFIIPKSSDDLSRRRGMMSSWAHASYGMMGRTPISSISP
jgi:4-hydroxyphenylacetate 3-monooxygenase